MAHRAAIPKKTKKAVKEVVKRRLSWHAKIFTHPLIVFFVLCTGVLLINLSIRVYAASYSVNAEVPAAPLPSGAFITSPQNNFISSSNPVDITGTCPSDSFISLKDNGLIVGSALCQEGIFTIQAGLVSGENDFTAQDYNVTNDPGPTTPKVSVFFESANSTLVPVSQIISIAKISNAPLSIINPIIKKYQSRKNQLPLVLYTNFSFKPIVIKNDSRWSFLIKGGLSPYIYQIDWGDGSILSKYTNNNIIEAAHVYPKAGYYPIRTRVVDAEGEQAYLQVAALVLKQGQSLLESICLINNNCQHSSSKPSGIMSWVRNWILVIWTSYAAVTLMIISYLLGRREEYILLIKKYPSILK